MKRFITLGTLVCMFFLSLAAQEVELTIETTAGDLKDAMTEEQRQTVTNLTLTGSMNDADFYLIRDDMPKLKILNMEHIEVDTIPEKAFYEYKPLMDITLPTYVKYLGNQLFWGCPVRTIWISGMFPGLGDDVCVGGRVDVLSGNTFCKKNIEYFYDPDGKTEIGKCECILSFDGKKLYLGSCRGIFFSIPDGVETIESKSFDGVRICTVVFRPSVRLIKKSAFTNILLMIPNSSGGEAGLEFNTAIPPTLEEKVFDDDNFSAFYLLVPKGSIDNYKNSDPQWMKFRIIDNRGAISIKENAFIPISIIYNHSGTSIISEEIISRMEITTLSGITLLNREVRNRECLIPKTEVSGVCLVKITLDNGSSTILKLNQ